MPYIKKSIGRVTGGAGNPSPKHPMILIFEWEDVKNFPTREVGVTTYSEGFALKEGAKLQPVYATPGSIEVLQESEGDADARGFKKGVKFDHPGNSSDIEDFIEYNSNRNLGAIVRSCNGKQVRIFGDPCNPLSLKAETSDTKDATKTTMTLQQDVRDAYRVLTYTGELPAIMDESPESQNETI